MIAHRQGHADVSMQNTGVLNIGALTNLDDFGITADDGAKPDAAVRAQFHIAHHLRTVSHPGRVCQPGQDAIELINSHKFPLVQNV